MNYNWVRINSIIVFVIAFATAIILHGCTIQTDNHPSQNTAGHNSTYKLITSILGCDIYYIEIENSSDVYLSKCADGSSAVNFQYGKTRLSNTTGVDPKLGSGPTVAPLTSVPPGPTDIGSAASRLETELQQTTSDEDRILELARQVNERRAALSKLNEHERSVLGLPTGEEPANKP